MLKKADLWWASLRFRSQTWTAANEKARELG
jgi:hypothetical protein